ncbi:MAG TPA: hypothetical protein DCE80_01295 [Ignavibacteriales bacterium]|nr:hypothetical protein [Ignavibacteriales bacterium]
MPKLKEVIISITTRCNSRCKMCDIPNIKTEELTTLDWMRLIKEISVYGVQTIVFSGGEPLLREDIYELISFAKVNNLNVCLTSNGYYLDETAANKLYQSGVDVVNISVEGTKQTNDYLRSDGSFNKAIAALRNLKKCKIEATIATIISKYNYKDLPYVVNLANDYGVTTIKFQPFSKIFLRDEYKSKEFLIQEQLFDEVKKNIDEAAMLCNKHGISTNPQKYLENVPFYLIGESFASASKCIALQTSCPINSTGEIYPCWVLVKRDMLIGNIKGSAFSSLWGQKKHQFIIEKINKNGCSGCMMSCYDERFGKEHIERRIILNIRKVQQKGFFRYVENYIKRWKMKLRFYIAYSLSFKEIVRRLSKVFRKPGKIAGYKIDMKNEFEYTLEEIRLAKRRLSREVRQKA